MMNVEKYYDVCWCLWWIFWFNFINSCKLAFVRVILSIMCIYGIILDKAMYCNGIQRRAQWSQ